MRSKQQYLSDDANSWHPHLMWFVPGGAAKSWGANLPGSPAFAAVDPEDGMTIFLVWVRNWSDGHQVPCYALTRYSKVERNSRGTSNKSLYDYVRA